MDLYVILRRNGWSSAEELQAAAERSSAEGDRRGDVRWIRSYVLDEGDGNLGTVCVYEAESEEAIRGHAVDAGLPADEVVKVADTVIVRPDPVAGPA
jgi:sporulation protein YlmC with PRC-barrel domain